MVPFLCGDLYKLLKSLMERFVKSDTMKDVTSAAKLTTIDLTKADILKDYSKVDIGFATEKVVKDQLKAKKSKWPTASWLSFGMQKLA